MSGIPPNVPNPGNSDRSQPSADEIARGEAYGRAEQTRNMVQGDINRDRSQDYDLRFRADGREDELGMARGGAERAYSPEQWERAMSPSVPERIRLLRMRFRDSVLPNLPIKDGMRRCW